VIRRVTPIVVVVILANLAMLVGVWANRRQPPHAEIVLTERELRLGQPSERDSSQHLALQTATNWWFQRDRSGDLLPWLTPDRLEALGFDCRRPAVESWRSCGLPRRVFAAWELDGPAWQRVVSTMRAEAQTTSPAADKANSYVEREIASGSRLVLVGVSEDVDALRREFPDRSRHLILRAVLSVSAGDKGEIVQKNIAPVTTRFMVPMELRGAVAHLPPEPGRDVSWSPRYRVRLTIGRRYEPWITAIEPIDTGGARH